jgi:hypothetical protein
MATGVPFDDVAKKRVLVALKSGSSLAVASAKAGFSPSTVRKHLQADPEFANAVADHRAQVNGEVEDMVLRRIMEDENISAGFEWLKRRDPYEFGDRKIITNQHVGPGGGPVQIAVATTDQLRELLGDPDSRAQMLDVVRQLPMIEATATEHG